MDESLLDAAEAPAAAPRAPVVERGTILVYRVFDAGDTIALDVAEKTLAGAKRVELGGELAQGLVIPVWPLEVPLGEDALAVPALGGPVPARASARVFEFGAVSIVHEFTIEPGTPLSTLIRLCDALSESAEIDARGREHRLRLVHELGAAVEKPHDWMVAEAYTIVHVQELRGASVAELARSEVVAKLLLGETSDRPLSAAVRDDILANASSYFVDDLVIADWNSALVVDPTGSRLIPHVLELAASQLLEFRYYDGLLDRELARVYDHVERTRPRVLRSPYAALTHQVLRRFMELTEFTERVDNAIKSLGDVYLARVYLAALRRLSVPQWRESVEAKLALVARAYDLLRGEVESARMQLLELIIVLLILAEIITAF